MYKDAFEQKVGCPISLDMRSSGLNCGKVSSSRMKWYSLIPHKRGDTSAREIQALKAKIDKIQNTQYTAGNAQLFLDFLRRQTELLKKYKQKLEKIEGLVSKAYEAEVQKKPQAPLGWRLTPEFFTTPYVQGQTSRKAERLQEKKRDIDQLLRSVEDTLALKKSFTDAIIKRNDAQEERRKVSVKAVAASWQISGDEREAFRKKLQGFTPEKMAEAVVMAREMYYACLDGEYNSWDSIKAFIGFGKEYKDKSADQQEASDALYSLAVLTGAGRDFCQYSFKDTLNFIAKQFLRVEKNKVEAKDKFWHVLIFWLGDNGSVNKKFASIIQERKNRTGDNLAGVADLFRDP